MVCIYIYERRPECFFFSNRQYYCLGILRMLLSIIFFLLSRHIVSINNYIDHNTFIFYTICIYSLQTTNLGFFTISFFMRSIASSDISWNRSSGKSSLHCDMLQNVSCLVSPPNGEHPVNRTYSRTPMDLRWNSINYSGLSINHKVFILLSRSSF